MAKINENTNEKWMLYGAYGYSGLLLLEEAVSRGHKPIIAGRDQQKITDLATKYGVEYRVFSLSDHNVIVENIKGLTLLFNAAGPFNVTNRAVIEACLEAGVNYMDISGEVPDLETCYSYHEKAVEKGIAIIPGTGFDVVPSDCLANYTAAKISNPTNMELAILSPDQYSPGTMQGVIENIPNGAFVRRNGEITQVKMGSIAKDIPFLDKTVNLAVISWGDVASGFRSTKIPNITEFMAMPKAARVGLKLFGFIIRPLFRLKFMQKLGKKMVKKSVKGPDKEFRESHKTDLWCRVTNEKGEEAESWLNTPEPYRLTGISGIRCMERFLSNLAAIKKGALTPVQAFGVDFILEMPETSRHDKRLI